MSIWKRAFITGFAVLFLFGVILCSGGGQETGLAASGPARFYDQTLVIDAGHGGEDGGAVSLSGTPESQINLALALRLDQILGLYGVHTVMTRDRDVSLHSEDAKTLHDKKVSDLHNRVKLLQSLDRAVLLSIHQNTYPSQRYSGAQVFYAPTEGSDVFAQTMQQVLKDALSPDNDRQSKQIPENIYLMNHISCCAILVECGFISNPQEEQLLLSQEYQTKVAAALAGGYLQFQKTLM